jgi:hypothetical protein
MNFEKLQSVTHVEYVEEVFKNSWHNTRTEKEEKFKKRILHNLESFINNNMENS